MYKRAKFTSNGMTVFDWGKKVFLIVLRYPYLWWFPILIAFLLHRNFIGLEPVKHNTKSVSHQKLPKSSKFDWNFGLDMHLEKISASKPTVTTH